ncbi:flagellar hook-length control protein FliK [Celeribacter neptunius]|uniref:flagellar hook-length control protein FliK n=1 Tax=Celeribacter neptunius TaxID=588602 RepID=UPI0015A555ED|nr:flagellar hook-length control protein FliK [Celeribacter neptunius]
MTADSEQDQAETDQIDATSQLPSEEAQTASKQIAPDAQAMPNLVKAELSSAENTASDTAETPEGQVATERMPSNKTGAQFQVAQALQGEKTVGKVAVAVARGEAGPETGAVGRDRPVLPGQNGTTAAPAGDASAGDTEIAQEGQDGAAVLQGRSAGDVLGLSGLSGSSGQPGLGQFSDGKLTGNKAVGADAVQQAVAQVAVQASSQAGSPAKPAMETLRGSATHPAEHALAEGLIATETATAQGAGTSGPKTDDAGATKTVASPAGAAAGRDTNAALLFQMGRNFTSAEQGPDTADVPIEGDDAQATDVTSPDPVMRAEPNATRAKVSADVAAAVTEQGKVANSVAGKPELTGPAGTSEVSGQVDGNDATAAVEPPVDLQPSPTVQQNQTQPQPQTAALTGAMTGVVAGAGPLATSQGEVGKEEALDPLAGLDDLPPGVTSRAEHEAAKAAASPTSAASRGELPTRVAMQIADAARQLPDRPMEITLSPEELGKVRLSFHVSETGAMHVVVAAERVDTLDLMRRNIDSLIGEFRDLGYSESGFSFESFDQGGQEHQDDKRSGFGGFGAGGVSGPGDIEAPASPTPVRLSLGNSSSMDLRL